MHNQILVVLGIPCVIARLRRRRGAQVGVQSEKVLKLVQRADVVRGGGLMEQRPA
jgi:hypothetical protein